MSGHQGDEGPRGKIVLCGPPRAGKATFLRRIGRALDASGGGTRLATLRTDDDRVLVLETLPGDLPAAEGRTPRLMCVAATGDVRHETTWRQLFAGADVVLFLADSDPTRAAANAGALKLAVKLAAERKSERPIPFVLAFNKRDLSDATPALDMERTLNATGIPAFETIASEGQNVSAAFAAAARLVFGDVAARRLGAL